MNEATGKEEQKNNSLPTHAKTGQLRLVRTGSILANYAAEGSEGEFKLLKEHPFGAEDLKGIGIIGATGSPKAGLDVRVTDILIRAESFPGLDVAKNAPKVPADNPSSGGLAGALLIGLIVTLTLALGVWLFVRRRKVAVTLPDDPKETKR